MPAVNLNADVGESYGRYTLGCDEMLMPIIRSASVACGFHAGDPDIMSRTVALAKAHGVSIGAHPSFNDVQGFGRRPMRLRPSEIENLVAYQIGALMGIAHAGAVRVTHVKPHGALNNIAHMDRDTALAIARAIRAVDRSLIFVATACSEMVRAGEAEGLCVVEEAYADRAYGEDGQLASRAQPDALITDPARAAAQVLAFLEAGGLVTQGGRTLPARIRTFCVHGDEPTSVAVATAVRDALAQNGVEIVPLPALEP